VSGVTASKRTKHAKPARMKYGEFIAAENSLWEASLNDPCNQMMALLSVSHIPLAHPDVLYDVLFEHRVSESGLPTSRFCYNPRRLWEMEPDREVADEAGSQNLTCQDAERDGYDVKHMQWRIYNRYHATIVAAQGLDRTRSHRAPRRRSGKMTGMSDEWFPHHVLRRTLGNREIWRQVNGGLRTDHVGQLDPDIQEEFCDTRLCWKGSRDACGYGSARRCSPLGPLCFHKLKLTKLAELISSRHPLFFRKVKSNAIVVDEDGNNVGRVDELLVPLIKNYSRF